MDVFAPLAVVIDSFVPLEATTEALAPMKSSVKLRFLCRNGPTYDDAICEPHVNEQLGKNT